MPIVTSESEISRLIKNGTGKNVWFVFGEDDFLKEMYCEKLIKSVLDDSLRVFNLHTFNDDENELDDIFACAETMPMMSEKIVVLVRNYPLSTLKKEKLREFEQGLRTNPDTALLIFYFNTIDIESGKNGPSKTAWKNDTPKWNEIIKIVEKYGIVARIDRRTPEQLAKSLVTKAKNYNTSISTDDAVYLVEKVGGDIQTVTNEFSKLCAFADGKPITKEMIDSVSTNSVEASIYGISDSILSGDVENAYRVAKEILRRKAPTEFILGTMASAFVNAYRYKLALNYDGNVREIENAYGVKGISMSSGVVRKIKLSSIKKCIDILQETDTKAKSFSTDDEILLTELIAKLAFCIK